MSKELLNEIVEEYPKVWEELKANALERHATNEKIMVEMRVLASLMKDGALQQIDVKKFKNTVTKQLKHREDRDKLKRRSISLTNCSNLSLKDLYDKLESMCSVISTLEKEVESLNISKAPNEETESNLADLSSDSSESNSSSF
jgi:hypothetical protein